MKKITGSFKESLRCTSFKRRIQEPQAMEETAEDYAGMDFSKSNAAFIKLMLPMIPLGGKKVVDFGCGPGDITIALAEARPDLTIVGVDLSSEMIAIAEHEGTKAGVNERVTWQIGDMTRPIFDPGSIDFIFSHTALHHLPKLEPFFRQMKRALRPAGGGFCIRDLRRPKTAEEAMQWIYEPTKDNLTERQYSLFFYSLRASFTLPEIREIVRTVGISGILRVPKKPKRYWVFSRPEISARKAK